MTTENYEQCKVILKDSKLQGDFDFCGTECYVWIMCTLLMVFTLVLFVVYASISLSNYQCPEAIH